MKAPPDPQIFHITHLTNLPGIIAAGGLSCHALCRANGVAHTNIGHSHIKQRRLTRRVETRADGTLGEYVPFNFCPRSVMLYVVGRGHQDYSGGQEDVVHLVSTVSRAVAVGQPWAFSDRHAELAHALHYDDLAMLGEVPWHVMGETYWQSVREERQAEFLVRNSFPWSSVVEIATMSSATTAAVHQMLQQATHQPLVSTRPEWYY